MDFVVLKKFVVKRICKNGNMCFGDKEECLEQTETLE